MVLASRGRRGDARRFEEAGFAGYLSKPIEQSAFYNLLLQVAGVESQPTHGIATCRSGHRHARFAAQVLVVEDNVTNQAVARGMLEKFGLDIDLVANGREALQALSEVAYDLVFMDCQMPVMDGYEASRLIRDPGTGVLDSEVPIVAMTANAMKSDRDKCLRAGMNDHIAKPVDPSRMEQALTRWLPVECQLDRFAATAPGPVGAAEVQARRDGADDDEAVFDEDALQKRMMGDEDLMRAVAEAFVVDMNGMVEQLKSHVDSGDMPNVGAMGHKIKGAAVAMGGMALGQAAREVEQAGRTDEPERLDQVLPLLERRYDEMKQAMRELLP